MNLEERHSEIKETAVWLLEIISLLLIITGSLIWKNNVICCAGIAGWLAYLAIRAIQHRNDKRKFRTHIIALLLLAALTFFTFIL